MAEGVQETVRISVELSKKIEEDFVVTNLFSSKADFITNAIRYYYENVVCMFPKLYNRYNMERRINDCDYLNDKSNLELARLSIINIQCWYKDSSTKGKKVTILLRLQSKFKENIEQLIQKTGICNSKNEFYVKSIEYYIDLQYSIGKIHEAIIKDDEKQIIRAVRRPYDPTGLFNKSMLGNNPGEMDNKSDN